MTISRNTIAIIGMAGRWPGARNVEEFWSNLCGGVESVRPFTEEEMLTEGVDPAMLAQASFVNAGAPLADAYMFDAPFFGISHREAQSLDPQHRVFLECAWHALEDACYAPESVDGPIGVFGGSSTNSYQARVYASPELVAALGAYQVAISNDKDHLTTYTAYKLNLTGPAVTVQTACSTSLVAVAMACQSLLNQECDLALAGGVSVRIPQHCGYIFADGGILSPDGHCRAFDAEARGTVGGNGVGVVVLKRLGDAVRDGDRVRAVILGSAINNDGSMKVGYTAPSVEGQAAVIATAMALAGVEPESISYLEAHGTGTQLGDPIEIASLAKAFSSKKQGFCTIGSVKGNIGHLDAAAGVAGLIKAALCVERALLPPSLHFQTPNRTIDFASTPFIVQDRLSTWNSRVRRAGVNSFGIGGTNAHAVLEQPPEREAASPSRPNQLLLLSARTETALDRIAANFHTHWQNDTSTNLADVAFTLATGRRAHRYRSFLVCSVTEAPGRAFSGAILAADHKGPVFLFPGQGSQHSGMGRGIYEAEPVFRAEFDRCADLLKRHVGMDIRRAVFDGGASEDELRQTWLAQPVLFAVEYSLARLLMSWGIQPTAMIGHSLGEYVAACLAGVMLLEDALIVVAARGMLMQDTAPGAMLATFLSEHEASALLPPLAEIAAVNSPTQTVVSGPESAIAEFEARLSLQGICGVRLRTSHAFHSSTMDQVLGQFRTVLQSVRLKAPVLPYIENRSGGWQSTAASDAEYWVGHLRNAVRFGAGCRTLCAAGQRTFIEVGPGSALSKLVQEYLREFETKHEETGSVVTQVGTDQASLLNAVGQLWSDGVTVDWDKYYSGERRRRVSVPLYPFEWQRYDAKPTLETLPQANWLTKIPDPNAWFYEPSWRAIARPVERPNEQAGPALVFLDDVGLGAAAAAKLPNVAIVRRGVQFRQTDDFAFEIRPEEPPDYDALFGALAAAGKIPGHILHFWNVDPSGPDPGAVFYPLLHLAQTLASHNAAIRVNVISAGGWAVTGAETVEPLKALIAGFCRVAPAEQAGSLWRNIDILPDSTTALEQILAEYRTDSPDPIVAYRGRRRWIETVESLQVPGAPEKPVFRPEGVYLITGGLGGVGFAIAEFLAREYEARLVLIGRSGLPVDSPRRSAIAALKEVGAQVLVCAADVADSEQMRRVLARTQEQFGRLDGVIHAAGIAGGGLIQLKERTAADAVLSPKVQGTLTLHALLQDVPLDFFVICSSLASLVGGVGQVDYCSANAFQDAFAQRESTRGDRLTTTINWDAWAEVGMAVNTTLPAGMEELRTKVLKNAILPSEGVDAFRMALGFRLPQICVSTYSLPLRVAQARMMAGSGMQAMPTSERRHARPEMKSSFVAASTEMEKLVEEIWQDLFGLEQVGMADNFFDLGGHSLLATQMATRVRTKLGVEISVRTVLEAPTIRQLSSVLERMADESEDLLRMIAMVEQMSDEQVKTQLEQN
jgi:acyl transferase domain-containing protein